MIKTNTSLKSAGMAIGAFLVLASPAFAGELSESISNIGDNIKTVPTLVNYASYIAGAAIGLTGISKLRAHVDNPAQNPIYPALGRLLGAALFVSLPTVLRLMQNTTAVSGGDVTYTQIDKISS